MAPRPNLKFRAIAFFAGRMMSPVEVAGPIKARQELLKTSTGPPMLTGRRPMLAAVKDDEIAGVRVRRYRPHGAAAGTIVFVHGGGWMLGGLDSHDILAANMAAAAMREVVSVEYRLAPEHRFPSGLEDCLAVTRALVTKGAVIVAGDSAGGNLAAVVANRVQVLAQLLMYPVTDCVDELPSHEHYATGHLLTRESIRFFRREYQPAPELRADPDISPLRKPDLTSSPPAYMIVAQCDVLRDEGVAYARRLEQAGVAVRMDEMPGTLHGFMSLLGLSEARDALNRAAGWLIDQFASAERSRR